MKNKTWLVRPVALAVSSCFGIAPSWGNPTGPQVMHGTVQIQGLGSNALKVTNTPGSIIHWQGFSIGAGSVTQFVQQSASSSVLNRVVGADISQIHGQLLSNGRVFLINPAGILIGAGAVIDTAGFVGSTLRMLDGDFLAGKLKFEGDGAAGSILNQGWIRAGRGGNIVLVAPNVENRGAIQTEGGQIVLAAGQKLTIGSMDLEGVQFEIQAPSDSVLNVGKLLADGGAVGVFAGTLKHSGDIRANALTRDEAGHIVLKAQNDVTLTGNSTTSAVGAKGGDIAVLGNRVSLTDNAAIDVSGSSGGGQIRIGGDYQGANASVQNAARTFVGPNVTLNADATHAGDGGRVIVWADKSTQYYGSLSARGGANGGNGGFAEVSGKENLVFAGRADLGAAQGAFGTLLLDPLDLFIANVGGAITTIIDEATDVPGNAVTVSPATLDAMRSNVILRAGRYMRFSDPVNLTTPGASLTATVDEFTPTLPAGAFEFMNQMDIAANITTNAGAVSLTAPTIQTANTPTISTSGGTIELNSTAGGISVSNLTLNAGGGAVRASAAAANSNNAFVHFGEVTGGNLTISIPGDLSVRNVTTTGPVSLTSSTRGVSTQDINSGGGNITATAQQSVFINGNLTSSGGAVFLTSTGADVFFTNDIATGSGNVALAGRTVGAGTIDTSGEVNLTATRGNVSATVNNAASINASSANTSNSAGVFIDQTVAGTPLNLNSVTATATSCSFGFCPGANININATGNVNVGTLSASAPTKSENISINSTRGSIAAMSGSSRITAFDVALTTTVGTGGGVGAAAMPVNVSVDRSLTLQTNNTFNVVATGSGPNSFSATLGVAPAGGPPYRGTVTRSSGAVLLDASANGTTVTLNSLPTSGFDQSVNNFSPFISFNVPNGALNVPSLSVAEGGMFSLPVSITASGNITINSYTRQGTLASTASSTTIQSTGATSGGGTAPTSITLGSINVNRDSVSVFAPGDVLIAVPGVSTAGDVFVFSNTGGIAVGRIDTTTGSGAVTLRALAGQVGASANNADIEIRSGSSIDVTARTIGNPALANPLDLTSAAASSITLRSQGTPASGAVPAVNGRIGFAGAPVVANTADLTIEATDPNSFNGTTGSTFNVTTGLTALQRLTVTANPAAVDAGGGLAQVTTEQGSGNQRTYSFVAEPSGFTFIPGTVPATQFVNGLLSFTSNAGDIGLGNANLGTGALFVKASVGSITGGAAGGPPNFDGAALTLLAGTEQPVAGRVPNVLIQTGNIGGAVRPGSVVMTAGRSGFRSRTGSVETGGTFNADNVAITSFNGSIRIGPNGDSDIASLAAPATGSVTLTSNGNNNGSSGGIGVGNVFADAISLTSFDGAIATRALNAASSITARSRSSIATGALDALALSFSSNTSTRPSISTGPIGGTRPFNSLNFTGTTVSIAGAVTGAGTATGNLNINASGQLSTDVGGVPSAITTGNGRTITLASGGTQPFRFTTIDAGATGIVSVNSNNGIQQTADAAGNGIFAQQVTLTTNTGAISNAADASGLDLHGTSSLRVTTGGTTALNANGSTLSTFNLTKSTSFNANPFTLSNLGSGQSVVIVGTGAGADLTVNSPTGLLDFDFNFTPANEAIALAGAGVVTSGGRVNITTRGALDASAGGITTGGADAGGRVSLFSSGGTITAGAINTTPVAGAMGTGGPINVDTNCASCNVVVSGNLTTGPGGGSITLRAFNSGSITRTGSATISSPSGVTVNATNGGVGTGAAPLLITTPTATLGAQGPGASGSVFATLTNTNNLTLSADNGFNVASTNTAFDILSVTSRGSGTGTPAASTLNLAAVGQSYAFGRPTADAFTNTFEVITAAGAGGGAPPGTATFRASDGDLLVRGGASLTSPDLLLNTTSGDLKLQGTASALNLSNAQQTLFAGRDILMTGNLAVVASAAQTLTANGNLAAQAQDGSLLISYSGSGTQLVRVAGNISLTGGSGTNQTARIESTGSGVQQVGESRRFQPFFTDNVTVQGGTGSGSFAEIASSGGLQQVFVAFDRPGAGTLGIFAGTGAGAFARIENTSASAQTIGASGFRDTFIGTIDMRGASGADSYARIVAAGPQAVTASGSTLLAAGTGANADALIRSTGPSQQTIRPGNLTLTAGGSATTTTTARAQIEAAGNQSFSSVNALTLTGGAGVDSFARINTPGEQRFDRFRSLTMTGGTNTGAFAKIDAGGVQNLQGGSGDIMLIARGTLAAPVSNAGATIEGHSQTLNCFSACDVTLTSGAGTSGNPSDAVFRNFSGNQLFSAGSLILNGGATQSTTGIVNVASTGTQSITTSAGDITLLSNTAALADASVVIQNLGAAPVVPDVVTPISQSITSARGLTLNNRAGGFVGITSLDTQNTQSQWIDVLTAVGSTGNSTISATGNQFIRTTNGATAPVASLRAAALGSGIASIDSAATQLMEIDYLEFLTTTANPPGSMVVGNAAGVGTSRLQASQQSIFARAITVQGGSASGSASKLTASTTQTISTVDGGISVSGGTGVNASAAIDPINQSIVANGLISVAGGGAESAAAAIAASGAQTVIATRDDVLVQGGTAPNARARIETAGVQVVTAADEVRVIGGGVTGATARIESAGESQTVTSGTGTILTGGSATDVDARITTMGPQIVTSSGTLALLGGTGAGAAARITTPGAQNIAFNALTMTAGAGNGAHAMIDSASTQSLSGGGGNIELRAAGANSNATIVGHSQTLTCGAACALSLMGASGSAAGAADAVLRNLSGAQAVNVGLVTFTGGQQFSTVGVINDGAGTQSVSASAGSIALEAHPNAVGSASVVIQNVPATAQTISALGGDTTLNSRGGGTVAITSAGTQSIDTRGLDIVTLAAGAANATVFAADAQTIRTRGALAAAPGVGMRVASLSSGVSRVESAANQEIAVDANQLLIGRLTFGPPGISDPSAGNPAAGDSLVLATATASDPNQTVRAGSVYIQGPSGSVPGPLGTVGRMSKLSGDGTQSVTTLVGGISIIGGSGANSLATIDPTNQTITSFGPILLQGGSGPNADAIINATGPQSVISQNGPVTLIGGTGSGADALIVTTSPFQTVQGQGGSAPVLIQGPAGGGAASLVKGANANTGGQLIAANNATNEVQREQDELNRTLEESGTREEERQRRGAQLCS